MHIVARVKNAGVDHLAEVGTGDQLRTVAIPGKPGGGSEVNGGELLFLALATCYCNDLYREAPAFGITIDEVEVAVQGEFGGVGEPAKHIRYSARVTSNADPERVRDLLRHTDRVAEIQQTVRTGCAISFADPA